MDSCGEIVLRPAKLADAGALAEIHLSARRHAMPWLPQGFMVLAGGMLEQLYVAPEHQGRGLGSRLPHKAKALAPGGLRLDVFQRNRAARDFYEARGFVAVAFTDGADNEEREPDVLYAWSPSPGPADSI